MRFVLALLSGVALAPLCIFSFAQSTTAPSASSSQTDQQTPNAPSAPTSTPKAPAPLKLEDLPADPHTPTPEEQAAAEAERQRLQIQQIAVAQNKWGPVGSTQGMSLTLKETKREQTANGTQITYQVQGTGFTPEMKLTLLRWPLNQNVTKVMDGLSVDAAGTVICAGADAGSCGKTMQAKAPVEIPVIAAKGEAIRLALSADKSHVAAVSFVPFPIEGTDKGCKLDIIRGSKDDELVLITGDGFTPGANFTGGSESFGEKRPLKAAPNANGHLVVAMTPWVSGHDEGDTVVYAQTDACTPTVSFHWGKGTYKPE